MSDKYVDINDAAKEVLGKPVYVGFDDNALKVRRNLFIFSSISLYLVITGVYVNTTDTVVFGVHLIGANKENVYFAFFLFNLYHFIHFLWYAIEALAEWRLRITGTSTLSKKNDSYRDQYEVNVSDPRQSTLYNWYIEILPILISIVPTCEMLAAKSDRLKTYLESQESSMQPIINRNEIEEFSNFCNSTHYAIERFTKTLGNERVTKSLNMFDDWFMYLQYSQNRRWVILECGLPLLLGVLSLILLGVIVLPYLWIKFVIWFVGFLPC